MRQFTVRPSPFRDSACCNTLFHPTRGPRSRSTGGSTHPDFDDSAWTDFAVGQTWGGYDITAWFRAVVTVPEAWRQAKVALRFLVGPRDGGKSTAETLLYVNGAPLQGIDVWHEEAVLPPEMVAQGQLTLYSRRGAAFSLHQHGAISSSPSWCALMRQTEQFHVVADTVLKP
jgi:alpha-mannosidase